MSMRVATFASSDRLLQAALKVQARQAEATLQQASGQISEDYGGLGGKAGSVVSLQSSISMSKAYASAASTALTVVEPRSTPRKSGPDADSSGLRGAASRLWRSRNRS